MCAQFCHNDARERVHNEPHARSSFSDLEDYEYCAFAVAGWLRIYADGRTEGLNYITSRAAVITRPRPIRYARPALEDGSPRPGTGSARSWNITCIDAASAHPVQAAAVGRALTSETLLVTTSRSSPGPTPPTSTSQHSRPLCSAPSRLPIG